jgi:hypothetical protein
VVQNVLLMLSAERQPSPLEEIRAHATVSQSRGKTALLATSFDDWTESGLEASESVVVLYGDSSPQLDNRLLGWGRFVAAHEWSDELEGGGIYAGLQKQKVKKKTVEYKTFLELRDFVVARSRDRLDDFDASLPQVARSSAQSKTRRFFERGSLPDPFEAEDAWRKSADARDACRILSLDPATATVRQAEMSYNKAIGEARNKSLLNRARSMIRQALYAERYHRE